MRVFTSLSIALLLALSACMSEKSVSKKYYVIGKPDDQGVMNSKVFDAIQGSCEIDQVKISPVYESNRIVNRADSHEITYYNYHQWAVRPSLTITEIVMNNFENSGIFEGVSTRYSRDIPDYRLATFIHQLEVIENKNEFTAHLHIEFRILNNSNSRVLVQHAADRTESVSSKNMNLFTSAISRILIEELHNFILKIDTQRSTFEREN